MNGGTGTSPVWKEASHARWTGDVGRSWVRKEFWTISPRLLARLDRCGVRYEIVPHRRTETALQAANAADVPANRMVKVVVFRDASGRDHMVAVPATHAIEPHRLQLAIGRSGVHLENETELERLFDDCEVGAMPPVGHLYGLPMVVDRCLTRESGDLWFQPGNHRSLVRMSVSGFRQIAQPYFEGMCLAQEFSLVHA
jgi:Ala-tRNA(Pro) deacylase